MWQPPGVGVGGPKVLSCLTDGSLEPCRAVQCAADETRTQTRLTDVGSMLLLPQLQTHGEGAWERAQTFPGERGASHLHRPAGMAPVKAAPAPESYAGLQGWLQLHLWVQSVPLKCGGDRAAGGGGSLQIGVSPKL